MARKPLTPEQKAILVARIKKARETKKAKREALEAKEKISQDKPSLNPTSTPTSAPVKIVPTEKKPYIGGHTLDQEPMG